LTLVVGIHGRYITQENSKTILTNMTNQNYDNLFNAEHRDIMIRKHGATEAQWITLEELILTT